MSDRIVVTAHQPNFLPGLSVVNKIRAADVVIWLDEVQYTKGGWTNRNRSPNGAWLTAAVERHCTFKPINRVRLAHAGEWRSRLAQQLRDAWPGEYTEEACAEILRPYGLLVGLNVALLQIVLGELAEETSWAFQSHLDGGHAVPAVSELATELLPISERLAMMVAELGGEIYLSGPSGRSYLDEEPFNERDIEVAYWEHTGPNSCCLEPLHRMAVAA